MTRSKYFLFSIFLFFITPLCFSQNADSITKYFLMDETNGFSVLEETSSSLVLYEQNYDVTIISKLENKESYNESKDYLVSMMEKLTNVYSYSPFEWNNKNCALATFEMTMDKDYTGMSLCVPTFDNQNYLLFLGYAPTSEKPLTQSIIMSCLNSICLDMSEFYTPGPIISFTFASENEKLISFNIGEDEITSKLNEVDEEASQFLIELEYNILKNQKYNNDQQKIESWRRYYRTIYRDNYARVKNVIDDVLKYYYPNTMRPNKAEQIVFAQKILSWVQNFSYVRAETVNESDFTSLPSVFCGKGNDCDSRSMMICAFMQTLDIECLLLISPQFAHALAALDINAPGQMFMFEDKNYLLGETTAKVTWGTIVKEHADKSKWFPVYLNLFN